MANYTMDATFTFQSDLTNEEIIAIKATKGDILTSDKITLEDFHEERIYEIIEDNKKEKNTSQCSCKWELSEGTDSIWNNLEQPMVDLHIEYTMDDKTQKELDAWMSFSMSPETKDRDLEDLWKEFKASYKA